MAEQQKDLVKKVVLEDAGDGSVNVTITFEDGSEYYANEDPCNCGAEYNQETEEYVTDHNKYCHGYEN